MAQDGWTPLHVAAQAGAAKICAVLVRHGANPKLHTKVQHTAEAWMVRPCAQRRSTNYASLDRMETHASPLQGSGGISTSCSRCEPHSGSKSSPCFSASGVTTPPGSQSCWKRACHRTRATRVQGSGEPHYISRAHVAITAVRRCCCNTTLDAMRERRYRLPCALA